MNQADQYFAYLLAEYKRLQREQRRELQKMPAGKLLARVENGKNYYMQFVSKSANHGEVIRRGITQNQPLLHALARKGYLRQSLKLLDKNIPALEKLLAAHKAPTPDNIIKSLPKAYQELPPEAFLPNLRRQMEWETVEYEQNTYRQESKIHITAKGLKVRSKSEVIIADKLDDYGIPYHYDELIYIENQTLSPDFIILCDASRRAYGSGNHSGKPDGSYRAKPAGGSHSCYWQAGFTSPMDSAEPVDPTGLTSTSGPNEQRVSGRPADTNNLMYWEHCGRVNDPAYMRHHKWKMSMYEKAGIVPWKNLIITYDDEQGNIDARIIDAQIRLKLL